MKGWGGPHAGGPPRAPDKAGATAPGEQAKLAQAPRGNLASAAHDAAKAFRDAFDKFRFALAPVTWVAHHFPKGVRIGGVGAIGLACHRGFALCHHAMQCQHTFRSARQGFENAGWQIGTPPGGKLLGNAAEAFLTAEMRTQLFHLPIGFELAGRFRDQGQKAFRCQIIHKLGLVLAEAGIMQALINVRISAAEIMA